MKRFQKRQLFTFVALQPTKIDVFSPNEVNHAQVRTNLLFKKKGVAFFEENQQKIVQPLHSSSLKSPNRNKLDKNPSFITITILLCALIVK